MRILLVEDDELIARGIVVGLRLHGLEVVHLSDVRSAEASYSDESFDAVILDLGLPDKDGMQLLAFIRAADQAMPILILSARDSIEHRLSGLQSGADDYMIKPFDLRELAARLHVLVRRSQGRATALIKAGPLCM
ncbi:MAG: response regulator, partial [Pararheinheimera sp.]|nr:response regulator [Rheinheimera sp.]